MRYSDFKLVEAGIGTKPENQKYIEPLNNLLAKGSPLVVGIKGDKGTLQPEPNQTVNSLQDTVKGTIDGEPAEVKVSVLFKSDEIKLELARVEALAKGLDPNEVKTTSSKEAYAVKPSDIFADERFPAKQVFNEVINNSKLQEQEIGQVIIEMAKEIQDGNDAQFKNIQKEFQSAIRDYAGEYLGVLALIRGTANFPTRKEWLKHLGVSNIDSIFINFPTQSNFALGDSIGSFENAETGNMILISSKGGKMGAPPSLNSLKIPDNLKGSPRYEQVVDFVETMQGASAAEQPFLGINKLFEIAPESINETVRKILPLSPQDINTLTNEYMDPSHNKDDWPTVLDEKYHPLVRLVDKTYHKYKETATPGGLIHYIITRDIINSVNERNAMPEFESMAREILQKNFIQIFARPKGAVLGFDILWPNVEMATGKVKLYSKASSNEPKKAKMSFSVTD